MPYKVLDGNQKVIAVCDDFIEAYSHVPFDSDSAQIRNDLNHIIFMFKKGKLNAEIENKE